MVASVIPLVVLAAVFQVISCQGPPHPNVPEKCRRPPEGVGHPEECCKIPPFFKDSDFVECGFQKQEDGPGPKPPHPHGPQDCTKQICMLKKYNLAKADESIDHAALTAFADKWAEANPDFKPAMEKAKEACLGKTLPGPPHICEANKMIFCISSLLFGNCPSWEKTEGCQKFKAHMEECAPYFKH